MKSQIINNLGDFMIMRYIVTVPSITKNAAAKSNDLRTENSTLIFVVAKLANLNHDQKKADTEISVSQPEAEPPIIPLTI